MSDRKNRLLSNAGHLVEVQCEDGIRLNGFLQTSLADTVGNTMWIVVHGVAGNFYGSSLLATIASTLQDCGHDTLRINTRGHDQITFASGSWPTLIGSAYELIHESMVDLKAWVSFGRELGYKKVNVVAHSLGAIKSAYFSYQSSLNSSDHFDELILVSPPRLRHESLLSDPRYGKSYSEDLQRAQELVASGHDKALIQIKFPQPLVISANTFVDKYGSSNRYDYLSWADQVPMANWIFGDLEVRGSRMNFANCDDMLVEKLGHSKTDRVHVVRNADHNYTSARQELCQLLCRIAGKV